MLSSMEPVKSVILLDILTRIIYKLGRKKVETVRQSLERRYMKKTGPGLASVLLCVSLMAPFYQVSTVSAQEVIWNALGRGLLYTRLEAESLLAGETDTVHVYNIDTSRYGLQFFDCHDLADGKPLSLADWYEHTDAPLVLNVCSDVQQQTPAAYLRISGRTIRSRLMERWKGLLVSDPSGRSRVSTRIVDMQFTPFDPSDSNDPDVYQQPMLLDESGEVRVKPRSYKATRVALGEDRHGNLLLFLTEKPHRLWDMARWLQTCPFSLTRAMNLGPGNAVQVLGRSPVGRLYILGQVPSGSPIEARGALREEAATQETLCCTMGVVALPTR